MKRAILVAAILVATGCGGTEDCPLSDHLEVTGPTPPAWVADPVPANTDVVLRVAAERCAVPLVGKIVFVTNLPDGKMGQCTTGCDGAYILVDRSFCGDDATINECALAHELGHYCVPTRDEAVATEWAKSVIAEARARLTQP